jgi:hypothetical protein
LLPTFGKLYPAPFFLSGPFFKPWSFIFISHNIGHVNSRI